MSDPVSWLLIEAGWQVVDADGQVVGQVLRGDQVKRLAAHHRGEPA